MRDLAAGTKSQGIYVVIDVYPYHVLTRDTKTGVKRSFNYGDLITLGIE